MIRGDTAVKSIALVFTGDEYADGGEVIRQTLAKHGTKASFFLTGRFYRNPAFGPLIKSLVKEGHYMGAHSDEHLLYCDWTKRDSLLVTQEQFSRDLRQNYARMAAFGVSQSDASYFLPPFEWYNQRIAEWTAQEGLQLVNFSPGTRSTADYTWPEMGKRYVNSEMVYRSIMAYEQQDPHGLNGFILLVHIGTDPRRTDKFYDRLNELLTELKRKGYQFVKINELL
ncbi:polysaccharide deacetylase family protein [Pontibacter kalidii]|uniref:polysaccharide deacetylase family protein n=1 Tax=Pontibacter kalidii TaxID=2592049 RepID=UPI002B1CAC60|nr:polysaccharide deacetylase family protein [Pontibacter kalidii]